MAYQSINPFTNQVEKTFKNTTDEELERMKPYGEAFIQEQLYMPQSITNFPFPTNAYVSRVLYI